MYNHDHIVRHRQRPGRLFRHGQKTCLFISGHLPDKPFSQCAADIQYRFAHAVSDLCQLPLRLLLQLLHRFESLLGPFLPEGQAGLFSRQVGLVVSLALQIRIKACFSASIFSSCSSLLT